MDPSLYLCAVRDSFSPPLSPPKLVSLQEFKEEPPLPDLSSISSCTTSLNKLPLYNFTEEEALLWADIDATFHLTNALPDVFWAFPEEEYPARQAFSVSYLTPRLIGNYNIGNWNCPGLEYFAFRRPSYFQYALYTNNKIEKPEGFRTLLSFNEEELIKSILKIQVDGLNLFISWQNVERSLEMALKTLQVGGNLLVRLEEGEPQINHLASAGQSFEKVYLFKPALGENRFLVCLKRKEPFPSRESALDLGKARRYLEYNNKLLHLYEKTAKEGLLPYLPPTTCYIRWNLPQEIKRKVICFKQNEDLLNLEEETGTEKAVLDSSQWNKRTSALAVSGDKVFLAKPYYLGGWNLLGEFKQSKDILDMELRLGGMCV